MCIVVVHSDEHLVFQFQVLLNPFTYCYKLYIHTDAFLAYYLYVHKYIYIDVSMYVSIYLHVCIDVI